MTELPRATGSRSVGSKVDYAMGSTDRERQRLMLQGEILRGPLEAAFRSVGITSGMRVLDIGCGVGDVAMLAAELVGSSGSVVALDRDAASIDWAKRRVAEAAFSNIHFHASEFDDFSDSALFDALVGRFILMYLPDPVATLRHLASSLRSGATIAFMEPDLTISSTMFPDIPLVRQCEDWSRQVFRRTGARTDMGMRLYSTYREAGFVGITTSVSHLSGCGVKREMIEFFVEGIRSQLPKLEEYGIATREEGEIDTLADRIEAAGSAADPQWVSARYIAAWARKP